MPCYHPLPGWLSVERGASGKRGVVFKAALGFKDRPVQVPCGRCIGCRLERARQWALRCVHEASCFERNCFVTLTYDDAHLPQGETLVPEHFVLFMKRLRKAHGAGIRFFQCGEYGEKLGRPHHHALLFNHAFDDMRLHSGSGDSRLYVSAELERLWPYGFSSIGEVSFESAGYVARYALKKVTGPEAAMWYGQKVPEYLTMSRRPGIGRFWLDKYRREVYPSDSVVINGHPCKPPRYYDDVVAKLSPDTLVRIKRRRLAKGINDPNSVGKRLLVREVVKEAAVKFLSRSMERS